MHIARNGWSVKYSVDAVGSAVQYRTGCAHTAAAEGVISRALSLIPGSGD